MNNQHFTDQFVQAIKNDESINEQNKTILLRNFAKIKNTKVNILITGATGCGKSSTINALFDTQDAKVGQGVDPETMDIAKYELDNIVLFDSPGLGDGKEADRRHAKNIISKLAELDKENHPIIDLVLVILDGSSRDLGTSFELINNVIIPSLGENTDRLLIAINQADMAMKGRYWNEQSNTPEPELIKFLDEKVKSTKLRVKEATGVDVEPIYYSAGYKDGEKEQNPYNLSKLFLHIVQHTKEEKRAIFAQDRNRDEKMWESDDGLEDYKKEIDHSIWESIKNGASKGADIGGKIGGIFGAPGAILGKIVGGAIGAIGGFFKFW